MQPDSLDRFGARCPSCAPSHPLELADEFESDGTGVRFGVLRCTGPECLAEFPIVDGVPIVRADAREFLAARQSMLRRRDDLPGPLETVLADTIDPGSVEDVERYYLSVYARDAFVSDGSTPGIVRLLDQTLGLLDRPLNPAEPVLDLGCGVGRVSFEFAARGFESVLGLDSNLTMLRCAAGVRRDGVARFGVRRSGVLYDPAEIECDLPGRERVELWSSDALDPPFGEGRFGAVVALNVLDCVTSPVRLLERAAEMLKLGGRLLLTTPYDWTGGVTPLESWIGGHSPRSLHSGDPASTLRGLLSEEEPGPSVAGLRLVAEGDDLEWVTHLHDRAKLHYRVHAVVAERIE